MDKLANVVYAYKSQNDDELELNVGDRIEVIGFEEEGWWKGKLKGRIGVFPSNFVQVIETSSSTTAAQPVINSSPNIAQVPNSHTNNINNNNNNKGLNLFGTKSSRNSLSSNHSLNSNSNNNSLINTTNSHNHNNLMMNNTQQQQDNSTGPVCSDSDPTTSEGRAKPIRGGIGYGDIFVAGGIKPKPLPADPITGNSASDRLNTSLANVLLKQVPRKPPPPAPTNSVVSASASVVGAADAVLAASNTTVTDTSNGTSADQAPALPPKPANQFSPLIQQHPRPTLPAQQHPHQHSHTHTHPQQQQQQVREQARVVYAYEPANDDELAMQVGDIIDIIDKDIEDAGWWKGELRGKIGVFPDNFVKLIELPEVPTTNNHQQQPQEWQHRVSNLTVQPVTPTYNHQTITNPNEVKLKSVFAATPKGFSKELESNLEKQSNGAAAFLSLKRNKLQQQLQSPAISATTTTTTTGDSNSTAMSETTNGMKPDLVAASLDSTNMTKLSHITANRAKGPSRRPPSNVLNKRSQLDQQQPAIVVRREPNGREAGDLSIDSLPSSQVNNIINSNNNHDNNLSSLPPGHQQLNTTPTVNSNNFASKPSIDAAVASTTPIKSSPSLDNVIDHQTLVTPKTSLRTPALDKSSKAAISLVSATATPVLSATTSTAATGATTTPPWMVELRKAHAEKKRDSILIAPAQDDELVVPSNAAKAQLPPPPEKPLATPDLLQQQAPPVLNSTQYDSLVKQISKHVSSEITELKEEVKKLQKDFQSFDELKGVLEVMKIELKACQSATENQKRYIKELVNNLADERKKISAMQDEIDRNLK